MESVLEETLKQEINTLKLRYEKAKNTIEMRERTIEILQKENKDLLAQKVKEIEAMNQDFKQKMCRLKSEFDSSLSELHNAHNKELDKKTAEYEQILQAFSGAGKAIESLVTVNKSLTKILQEK